MPEAQQDSQYNMWFSTNMFAQKQHMASVVELRAKETPALVAGGLAAYPEPQACAVPGQSCQTSCSTLGDFTARAIAPWEARTPDLEVNSLTL